MNHRLVISILSTSLFLMSCGAAGGPAPQRDIHFRPSDTVIQAQQRIELENAYNQTNLTFNKSISRTNPTWMAENLLPKISSWFTPGRGLSQPQVMGDDVTLYFLAPLPVKLLQALQTNLGATDSRLAILRTTFWQKIAKAQRQGLKIGFMASNSQIEALGVYYSSQKVIGLSSIGEENTFDHELRHHEQYKAIRHSEPLESVDAGCIRSVSTAFGEIDATEIELSSYLGTENYMDRWLPLAGTDGWPTETFDLGANESSLLTINVEYPFNVASKVVVNESCSDEIRQVMETLSAYFGQSMNEMTKILAEAGDTVVRIDTYEKNFRKAGCQAQSSSLCERIQARIQENREAYGPRKQAFRLRLEKEIAERRPYISRIVEGLSPSTKRDLCFHAIGFSNFLRCEVYR